MVERWRWRQALGKCGGGWGLIASSRSLCKHLALPLPSILEAHGRILHPPFIAYLACRLFARLDFPEKTRSVLADAFAVYCDAPMDFATNVAGRQDGGGGEGPTDSAVSSLSFCLSIRPRHGFSRGNEQ